MKMDENAIRQIDRSMPAELEEENRKCMVDKACDPVDNL